MTLGDGHELEAIGQGIITLEMKLPDKKTKRCELPSVLYVPKLSYSLLSVSKAAEAGKTVEFDETHCQILGANQKPVAMATKVGSLYCLECTQPASGKPQVNAAETQSKAFQWHRRFGHLGVQSLQKLS